jgi:hypothetical protein
MLQLAKFDKYVFSGSYPICSFADAVISFKYPNQDHKISRCIGNVLNFEALKGLRRAINRLVFPKTTEKVELTAQASFKEIKKCSKQSASTTIFKRIASVLGRVVSVIALSNDLDLTSWSPSASTAKAIDIFAETASLVHRTEISFKTPKTDNPHILDWQRIHLYQNAVGVMNILKICLKERVENRFVKLAWSLSEIFSDYFIYSQKKNLKKSIV